MLIKQHLVSVGWPQARFSWNPYEHVAYYSPRTLRALSEQHGLVVLKIGSIRAYPRALGVFEVLRRTAFWATARLPAIAPEVFLLAKTPS
jgi:hypothetical protein